MVLLAAPKKRKKKKKVWISRCVMEANRGSLFKDDTKLFNANTHMCLQWNKAWGGAKFNKSSPPLRLPSVLIILISPAFPRCQTLLLNGPDVTLGHWHTSQVRLQDFTGLIYGRLHTYVGTFKNTSFSVSGEFKDFRTRWCSDGILKWSRPHPDAYTGCQSMSSARQTERRWCNLGVLRSRWPDRSLKTSGRDTPPEKGSTTATTMAQTEP